MNIFNVVKAQSTIKELEKDKLTLVGQLEVAQKDLASAQDTIGTFMEEKKSMDKTIADLKAEHSTAIKALEDKHKIETDNLDKSVKEAKEETVKAEGKSSVKAATILANLGVPIDDLPPISTNVTNNSPEAKLNTFLAMPAGKEKTAYYNANRQSIVAASNARAANK